MLSLNCACSGSFFRFPEGKLPEVLIVYYGDFKGKVTNRQPGGSVQFEDISNAFGMLISNVDEVYHEKLKWIRGLIPGHKTSFEAGVETLKSDKSLGKKELFMKINILKDSKLKMIVNVLNENYIPESFVKKLASDIRLIVMNREVCEETDASPVSLDKLIMASSSWVGSHEKCGFVSCDVVAPDSYTGSGDMDIYGSAWLPIDKALEGMFEATQSSHKNLLQSGIRRALELKLHPRIEELKPFLTATNE